MHTQVDVTVPGRDVGLFSRTNVSTTLNSLQLVPIINPSMRFSDNSGAHIPCLYVLDARYLFIIVQTLHSQLLH